MAEGKNIVLGVTGSIAAYKAADLTSRLAKAEADVHVASTSDALLAIRHPAHIQGPFAKSSCERSL